MTSRPDRARGGFTLLETLVVLAVLGLALGLVALYAPGRSRPLDLPAAAEDLARTLRLGRARAIAGNRTVQVAIDTANHAFALDGAVHALPEAFGIVVTARNSDVRGAVAAIGFSPDGSSSGGRVELSDSRRRMRVEVDWLTGRVTVTDAP